MSTCGTCGQDMEHADSCIGSIDSNVVPVSYATAEDIENGSLRRCSSCHVAPGGTHHRGCGAERCSVCGMQAICCCEHEHDPDKARWIGLWPGTLTCRKHGWWAQVKVNGVPVSYQTAVLAGLGNWVEWHIPCAPDDPFAYEDLNRCAREMAKGTVPLETT